MAAVLNGWGFFPFHQISVASLSCRMNDTLNPTSYSFEGLVRLGVSLLRVP